MASKNPDYKRRLRQAKKRAEKTRAKIKNASEAGDMNARMSETNRYLKSFDAKLVAAYNAVGKKRGGLKPDEKHKLAHEIAGKLNPWKGTNERASLDIKLKPFTDSDFRPTVAFGLKNHALQLLVTGVLEAIKPLHPNQYACKGNGVGRAIKRTLHELHSGYTFTQEIDIDRCFNSFDADAIVEVLPLPKEVTTNVIIGRHLDLALRDTPYGTIGKDVDQVELDEAIQTVEVEPYVLEARHGIPQGAATSNLVCEILFADIHEQFSKSVRVISYADNFRVFAKNATDLDDAAEILWAAFTGHPAGPLAPKIKDTGNAYGGFNFLGYEFERTGEMYRVKPSAKNIFKHNQKLKRRIRTIRNPKLSPSRKRHHIIEGRKYVKSWSRSFRLWDGASSHCAERLAFLKTLACDL